MPCLRTCSGFLLRHDCWCLTLSQFTMAPGAQRKMLTGHTGHPEDGAVPAVATASLLVPQCTATSESLSVGPLQFLGGENMLTGHTDAHWRAVRKAVAPAFSAGNMRLDPSHLLSLCHVPRAQPDLSFISAGATAASWDMLIPMRVFAWQ